MRSVRRRYVNRLPPPPPPRSELEADLMAVFKLDSLSSQTDAVANLITLPAVNQSSGLAQVAGIDGSAIRNTASGFNEVGYYQAPGTLDLTNRSMSVFIWAKMVNNGGTQVIDNQNLLIGSWKRSAGGNLTFTGDIDWLIQLYRFTNGTYSVLIYFNDNPYFVDPLAVDGNWNLYGFTYNFDTQQLVAYHSINGALTSTPKVWNSVAPYAARPGATMFLAGGIKVIGNKSFTHHEFHQDETYIWMNRALSAGNVSTLYRNGQGRFYPGFHPV